MNSERSNNSQIESRGSNNIGNIVNEDYEFKDLELSPDIRQTIIREAFLMFDADNSGKIDKKEFTKLVKSLGMDHSPKNIERLMKEIDKDNSGEIDMDEFTEMMMNYHFNKDIGINFHINNAFNLYDKEQTGLISTEDLLDSAKELQEDLSGEEALFIIHLAKSLNKDNSKDKNKPGITLNDFYNMLTKLNFLQESNPMLDSRKTLKEQDTIKSSRKSNNN